MSTKRKTILALGLGAAAAIVLLLLLWVFAARIPKSDGADRRAASTEAVAEKPAERVDTRPQRQAATGPASPFPPGESPGEIKARALAGDATAQRQLSEMYDLCYFYNFDPERQVESMRSMAMLEPRSVPGMEAMIGRLENLCGELDGGQPFPSSAIRLWIHEAASNGDLVARVRVATWLPDELDQHEFDALLQEAMAAGDSDALFEIAELVRTNRRSENHPELAAASGSDLTSQAWAVAACKLGATSCAAGSYRMSVLCMTVARCHHASYETFVKQDEVPLGYHPRLEQRVQALVAYFRSQGAGG